MVQASVSNDSPTQTVSDFISSFSDSANLQLRLQAPLMEYFGNMEKPYADFSMGIEVSFYEEGIDDPSGKITAKFARYFEEEKLWEVRDSVVAINDKGEILETELLFWDEKKELIYTEKFVRITQEDQIIRGTGLESDPRFSDWTIKNVSAILYLDNE